MTVSDVQWAHSIKQTRAMCRLGVSRHYVHMPAAMHMHKKAGAIFAPAFLPITTLWCQAPGGLLPAFYLELIELYFLKLYFLSLPT
jgi:hypothetical protein